MSLMVVRQEEGIWMQVMSSMDSSGFVPMKSNEMQFLMRVTIWSAGKSFSARIIK